MAAACTSWSQKELAQVNVDELAELMSTQPKLIKRMAAMQTELTL